MQRILNRWRFGWVLELKIRYYELRADLRIRLGGLRDELPFWIGKLGRHAALKLSGMATLAMGILALLVASGRSAPATVASLEDPAAVAADSARGTGADPGPTEVPRASPVEVEPAAARHEQAPAAPAARAADPKMSGSVRALFASRHGRRHRHR